MAPLLPVELLQSLSRECSYRDVQTRQLAILINPTFTSPSTLVVYGHENTGKLHTVQSVLQARSIPYVLVKSRECLSQRHLLSKIFAALIERLEQPELAEQYDRIDSINALVVNLQKLLGKDERRFALVLDGIDKQRGTTATLLPALARLGDLIPNLTVIFISASPRPLLLHKSGVPYIRFPPYSRAQAISILNARGPPPTPSSISVSNPELLKKNYLQFLSTVYDSLIAPTSSSSLDIFKSTSERLWPRFIWPFLTGETLPGKAKSWDFGTLYVRSRSMFQTQGESVLVERWRPTEGLWTFDELEKMQSQQHHFSTSTASPKKPQSSIIAAPPLDPTPTISIQPRHTPLLKQFSALLVTSAYLASHTHPKLDIILFSRLSSGSKSYKVRRRKLSKPHASKSPSKQSGSSSSTRHTAKSLFASQFNLARPFTLERATAILRAIHPAGVGTRKAVADRVYREMAELERLRLVVCVGGNTTATAGNVNMVEDGDEKWRINVGREMVESLSRRWGLGALTDYELET